MASTAVDHAVDTLRRAPESARTFVPVSTVSGPRADHPLTDPLTGRVAHLARALAEGEMTSLDLTMQALDRAAAWPGVVTDLEEVSQRALDSAAIVDNRRAKGEHLGALAGLPVTVKDNVDVAALISGQGGSLGSHRALTDSGAWSRLEVEGAVLIGHTSMHELAWGLTTPGCPNPWGARLTPGGSSGGAAASVAAGIASIAIGTDTGGSVRVPAALCGVAGLRPTHGVVSMRGIASLAPSLDTVGVLAQTAADCVWAHELMSTPAMAAPERLDGLRVGVLAGWQGRVSAAVATAMDDACAVLREHGVQIVELELAHARLAPSVAYVLMLIESSRIWLAEAQHRSTDVGPDVLENLREGGRIDVPGGPYRLALDLARTLRLNAEQAMRSTRLSAFIMPVIAASGVREEARAVEVQGGAMATTDALSRYTALASVTGLPALSVPAGLEAGCPVAIQLIGAPYDERMLALLAGPIEQGPGLIVAARRDDLRAF